MIVSNSKLTASVLAFILALTLVGCGGGGGSSATSGGGTIAGAPPPPANRAPTIGGSPSGSATEGNAYSFEPSANDPDGDTLSFSASSLPTWLTISSSSGRLSGTPPTGSVGTYGGIVVSVSDGRLSTSLPAFSITVTVPAGGPPPNTPPAISGTPATSVTVGQAYAFQPAASDPDGQTLRFGIANKPAWADFDIVSGRLSGTPAATDAATYANIVISVSDGTAAATLPPFNIVVLAPVIGSADLTWTAPTQNEDGSALTDLAGYKVRYGQSVDSLTQVATIAGAAITTLRIEGLAGGTWYFTVASYTNTGVESRQTAAVSKTIN